MTILSTLPRVWGGRPVSSRLDHGAEELLKMKRAFSMTELQAAIAAGSVKSHEEELQSSDSKCEMITLRRSKSMGSLSQPPPFGFGSSLATLPGLEDRNEDQSPTEPTQMLLPSLSSLGLSIPAGHPKCHGYEELKRSRGATGSNPSLCTSPPSQQPCSRHSSSGHDEETRGAAAALMDLFRQQPTAPVNSYSANFTSYSIPASSNTALPSLQDLMSHSNVNFGTPSSSGWPRIPSAFQARSV